MEYNGFELDNNRLIESLGFKCGLEIHQQLNTQFKLFCHCPVGLTKDKYDAEILRHMRPTLSELGEYDGTALMEFKTKKNVIYRLYRDRTCTYEMDDTPPFLVNQQAVDYAIRLAILFNCRIIDELHVVRKQYLDGSIPTGFQRTMIVGVDGWVPYKNRRISIRQVNLEEEACREISDVGHQIVFATDRLSIPLVEIITDADMKNPDEAADVCRLLGNAMKITGLVRRGIGTVRQDVNVSIAGGSRVEVKGVYKVGNIKYLTAVEAFRQKKLLELKEIFNRRFRTAADIRFDEMLITQFFSGSANDIGRRLESDRPLKVVGLLLPDLADIIAYKLQPNRDFGFELSGRVKVIACIDSKPNLFFYSQRANYNIPESLWGRIRDAFRPATNDDVVVICGPSADVATAVSEIKIRISELAVGIINETRQDLKDGTTDFERILPGPDRMYPDTDHPPIKIDSERVSRCRADVVEPLWEKQRRWLSLGLNKELIKDLSLSTFADVFDRLAQEKSLNLKKVAHYCTALLVAMKREGYELESADRQRLFEIIRDALKNNWPHIKLKDCLVRLSNNESACVPTPTVFDEQEFDRIWSKAESEFSPAAKSNSREKFRAFVTGRLLQRFPDVNQVIPRVTQKLMSAV
jgi:glutamyl-tRNA(Gln) amidotransferase subunit E